MAFNIKSVAHFAHIIWTFVQKIDTKDVIKTARDLQNKAQDLAEEAMEAWTSIKGEVVSWWNRKRVALIGPTASGKTSFWCRLNKQDIPTTHNNTRTPEMRSIEVRENFCSDGKEVEVRFYAKGVDVGGEVDERERFWKDACDDADIIFFLVNTKDILEGKFKSGDHVFEDMKWISANISSLKKHAVIHVLFNFIDVVFESDLSEVDAFQRIESRLSEPIDEFMDAFGKIMYPHSERIIGATPISMKDNLLYRKGLLIALNEIYKAQNK